MYLKDHFSAIMTDVVATIMGIAMAIFAPIINHQPITLISFIENWAVVYLLIISISWFLPYAKWGEDLVSLFKMRKHNLSALFVSSIVPAILFNTLCTFVISALNIFNNSRIPNVAKVQVWLSSCGNSYFPLLIVAYFISIIAQIIGQKLGQKFVMTN